MACASTRIGDAYALRIEALEKLGQYIVTATSDDCAGVKGWSDLPIPGELTEGNLIHMKTKLYAFCACCMGLAVYSCQGRSESDPSKALIVSWPLLTQANIKILDSGSDSTGGSYQDIEVDKPYDAIVSSIKSDPTLGAWREEVFPDKDTGADTFFAKNITPSEDTVIVVGKGSRQDSCRVTFVHRKR